MTEKTHIEEIIITKPTSVKAIPISPEFPRLSEQISLAIGIKNKRPIKDIMVFVQKLPMEPNTAPAIVSARIEDTRKLIQFLLSFLLLI